VLAALVIGWFALRSLAPPTNVEPLSTVDVTRGHFDSQIESSGSIAPVEQVTIAPEVDGTVAEVHALEGSVVEKGQLLFVIENPDLDRQVETAQRGVDSAYIGYNGAVSARNNANTAKNRAYQNYLDAGSSTGTTSGESGFGLGNADGSQDPVISPNPATSLGLNPLASSGLSDSGSSAADVAWDQYLSASAQADSAQQQVDSAWLQVKEAESQLASVKQLADKRSVYAPISGQVVVSNIERGTKLSTLTQGGKAPMQIAEFSSALVTVQVNEIDILKLQLGQDAVITFDAIPDYKATAKVSRISTTSSASGSAAAAAAASSGGRSVVTYAVDLRIESPDPRLKIDMSASAVITVGSLDNVLIVSAFAIQTVGEESAVTLLSDDETQTVVPVRIITSSDQYAVIEPITEGAIKEGDRAVVGLGVSGGTGAQGGGAVVVSGM
jgi:HlyD family secretion protein